MIREAVWSWMQNNPILAVSIGIGLVFLFGYYTMMKSSDFSKSFLKWSLWIGAFIAAVVLINRYVI